MEVSFRESEPYGVRGVGDEEGDLAQERGKFLCMQADSDFGLAWDDGVIVGIVSGKEFGDDGHLGAFDGDAVFE